MKDVAEAILYLIVVLFWIAGIVLAKGFWSTAAAIILPPWGWYLIVERWLQMAGWIAS